MGSTSITDRATLLTRLKKVVSRKADDTEAAIEQMLKRIPTSFIKTLTVDNDKGFANHASIAKNWMWMCTPLDPTPLRLKGRWKTE